MADIKLIHCNSCADIIRLYKTTRTCACGKSGGHYKEDGVQAIIWGNCKPLAFSLRTFSDAVQSQRTWGSGREFSAYVIPKVSPQIDHVDFELTNAAELANAAELDSPSVDPFSNESNESNESSKASESSKANRPSKNVFRDGPGGSLVE
tara:strand:+ start:1361 stop:1810 length:450 start_codon:yes stop_codon:yes gene_type:complete